MRQVKQLGFTIIELLIVMVAASLIMGLSFDFFWQYWQHAEKSQTDLNTFSDRLDTSDYIRFNVGSSSGLIAQNSIPDTNANTPESAGSSYWQIIHPIPETITTNSSSDQPILYFKRLSQSSDKSFIFNGAVPYEDEYIMYLSREGQLRIRSLANLSASGNALTTSCPPEQVSSSCPVDKRLMSDVSSISPRYFSRSGNLLDYTPVWDPELDAFVNGPDYPAVEVIELTISIAKKADTQTTNTTQSGTIIRVALRNN